jgi:hypothetical protein
MKVSIAIERSLRVPGPIRRLTPMLADLEGTLRHFPRLSTLTPLGDQVYLWQMKRIGSRTANIQHEVRYAARYHVDTRKRQLTWEPVPGHGNAHIGGKLSLETDGDAALLHIRVQGELLDVPVPLLYRPLAGPFIQGKFACLVDGFLENLRDAAG